MVNSTCTLDDFCRIQSDSLDLSRECWIYIERDGCKVVSGDDTFLEYNNNYLICVEI